MSSRIAPVKTGVAPIANWADEDDTTDSKNSDPAAVNAAAEGIAAIKVAPSSQGMSNLFLSWFSDPNNLHFSQNFVQSMINSCFMEEKKNWRSFKLTKSHRFMLPRLLKS